MSTQIIKTSSSNDDDKKHPRINEPMLAVLHVDQMDEWAVYIGPESWGAKKVEKQGDKVPPEMARFIFPYFVGNYRI